MNSWLRRNRWSVYVLIGIIFLVIGIFHGQLSDMYQKAIMICLECIGIG